jgi:hypothetical protein
MDRRTDDLIQTKLAAAYLAAAIVQTLNESDPTFRERFLQTLSKAYGSLRDQAETVAGLELLVWTREILEKKGEGICASPASQEGQMHEHIGPRN